MKILSIIFSLCLILSCAAVVEAQKTKRKTVRTNVVQKPKVEIENWQEFDSKTLKLKILFPKTPTISEKKLAEDGIDLTSTSIQTDINDMFYLLEVSVFPKNTLPKRDDLGEVYATWIKTYVLSESKILSEKTINFGKTKGIEFIYQDTKTAVIIHRILIIGQKMFQMMIHLKITKPDTYQQTIDKNKERIDKFFDSLQLHEESVVDGTVARK